MSLSGHVIQLSTSDYSACYICRERYHERTRSEWICEPCILLFWRLLPHMQIIRSSMILDSMSPGHWSAITEPLRR